MASTRWVVVRPVHDSAPGTVLHRVQPFLLRRVVVLQWVLVGAEKARVLAQRVGHEHVGMRPVQREALVGAVWVDGHPVCIRHVLEQGTVEHRGLLREAAPQKLAGGPGRRAGASEHQGEHVADPYSVERLAAPRLHETHRQIDHRVDRRDEIGPVLRDDRPRLRKASGS